jgi:hypothetical protein
MTVLRAVIMSHVVTVPELLDGHAALSLARKREPRDRAVHEGVCQKTVAQSFLMLTIVQPLLPPRSCACSAPLV